MSFITGILVLAAIAFVVYAIVTQYKSTPADQSVPKRVLAAVSAAAAVLAALATSWFHSGATP